MEGANRDGGMGPGLGGARWGQVDVSVQSVPGYVWLSQVHG
jgi:hypothetical protein